VLRYSLSGFSVEGVEAVLVHVNRTLKRNEALDAGRVQSRIIAAVDGIEVHSSHSRCCDACLERRVVIRKHRIKTEQVQYYHRAVGCQIIGSPVESFAALEWLRPDEGEEAAALRLLGKIHIVYGRKFFDILLLGTLSAEHSIRSSRPVGSGPAKRLGRDHQLKQNQRDLYQSAVRLFARRPVDATYTEQRSGKTYQVQLWDTGGLPFSGEDPRLVRVIRSQENLTENHYRQNHKEAQQSSHEWLWITTL
jgi:hypothetical protein